MVFPTIRAALFAAIFLLNTGPVLASEAINYVLSDGIILRVEQAPLRDEQLARLKMRLAELSSELDRTRPDSLITQFSAGQVNALPEWFFNAVEQCERWHRKSEGKFTCRNGRLKEQWQSKGSHEIERREVRKLARSARIADVVLSRSDFSIKFDKAVVWDLSDIKQAVLLNNAAADLNRLEIHQYLLTATSSGQALTLSNSAHFSLEPWDLPVYPGSKETGVISHNDGWPAAMFASNVIADNAVDAFVIGYLAASTPSRELFTLLDETTQFVQLQDEQGRLYYSEGWHARVQDNEKSRQKVTVDIQLPAINVADYQGPYVTAWITDNKSKLIKNLLIQGSGESWLKELRVWWRKIGRKNEQLIDGMSGATSGNKPVHLVWDGLDQFGKVAGTNDVILHIEAAREHGERTYQQIPLSLTHLPFNPLSVEAKGELGEIVVQAIQEAEIVGLP